MRCPFRFPFIAATASNPMSSRPPYGGGRNQRRGFLNHPYTGGRGQIVTGNSHFESQLFNPRTPLNNQNQQFHYPLPCIQNQQFRQSPNYMQIRQFRPPPPYNQNQNLCQPPPSDSNQAFQCPPPQHPPRPRKPLDFRNWEYAKITPPNFERFIVLSYNTLADYLAIDHRMKLYFHIPRHMLDWEWRKRNIIFELRLWSADIMCFQEVDRFHDLEEELNRRGYSGIWKMRTGNPVDGCAIFWRTSRFKLLHEECIEFNKLGLRDNVAQICVLELMSQKNTGAGESLRSSADSNKVVICNIHVLYNPKRGEIKLGQVRILLDRAYAVSRLWDDAPVVLCGDFNCTPKSPLYNFISEQKMDLSEVDRDKISGQASAEISPPRLFKNPRAHSADYSAEAPATVDNRDVGIKLTDSPSDTQKWNNAENHMENINKENEVQKFTPLVSPHDGDVPTSDLSHGSSNENSDLNAYSASGCLKSESSSSQLNGNHEQDYSAIPFQVDVFDEKLENSSINEQHERKMEGGNIGEDCTFLPALHSNEYGSPSDPQFHSPSDEVPNDFSSGLNSDAIDTKKAFYDPSLWTPIEIETATGKADCTILEHLMKLKSTYTEVEDCSGTRDSSGEPMVTSYNRCFLGTVDYIWRSEGLQTVRVLAPIPKHAMQLTPGFPTKKWGSDHIALASELVFTKGINNKEAS